MEMLLACCARASAHAGFYRQLEQLTRQEIVWDGLAPQAERHGLGPLLYTHLQAAHVAMPDPVKRELQGLYLRHRRANQVKAQVLAEILTAYRAAGIDSLVLKGAALAHLVYPEPGLRPMRDVDILIRKSQAGQAQAILAELGFEAALPPRQAALPAKHLPAATRQVEGLLVSVEIHHNLFAQGTTATELAALLPASIPFSVAGVTAFTLGYEAMLWHLYQHMKIIFGDVRLIWVADLVSFAEHFSAAIDWPHLQQRYPQILNTLALFHFLTPLSETLLARAPLHLGRAPGSLDLEFKGWPRYSLANQPGKGFSQIGRDSFFPPEGWLRLYYGFKNTPLARAWYRWARHPLHILGWAANYIMTRS